MANLLTITKEPNDYFTFVLNGDSANAIKNTRNDLTMIGDFAHFKTSNGANLIKEQNVLFGNITIINGIALPTPISPDDLFAKLNSVNFFDWIFGTGSVGVDRFDDLLDTFDYFGNDGKVPIVDESQLKLVPFTLPDTSKLDDFPTPLIPLKFIRVKADGSEYEFVDIPNFDEVPKIQFTADGITDTFDIGVNAQITCVLWNGVPLDDGDWSQTANTFTLTFIPELGQKIKPI